MANESLNREALMPVGLVRAIVFFGFLILTIALLFGWRYVSKIIVTTIVPADSIHIEHATFGANCTNGGIDLTSSVREFCAGGIQCKFPANISIVGEPDAGCEKVFSVAYTCSPDGGRLYAKSEPSLTGVESFLFGCN